MRWPGWPLADWSNCYETDKAEDWSAEALRARNYDTQLV
jgi:hypothetical protein